MNRAERIARMLYAVRQDLARERGYGSTNMPWEYLAQSTRDFEIDAIKRLLDNGVIA